MKLKVTAIVLSLLLLCSVSTASAWFNEPTAEEKAQKKAEELVEKNQERKIVLYYAKKLNKIKNLEANIARLKREYSEIRPEEIEVDLDTTDQTEVYALWTQDSTNLVLASGDASFGGEISIKAN